MVSIILLTYSGWTSLSKGLLEGKWSCKWSTKNSITWLRDEWNYWEKPCSQLAVILWIQKSTSDCIISKSGLNVSPQLFTRGFPLDALLWPQTQPYCLHGCKTGNQDQVWTLLFHCNTFWRREVPGPLAAAYWFVTGQPSVVILTVPQLNPSSLEGWIHNQSLKC